MFNNKGEKPNNERDLRLQRVVGKGIEMKIGAAQFCGKNVVLIFAKLRPFAAAPVGPQVIVVGVVAREALARPGDVK